MSQAYGATQVAASGVQGSIPATGITDVMVAAAAAIALSKLAKPTVTQQDSNVASGTLVTATGAWGRFITFIGFYTPSTVTDQVADLMAETAVGSGVYVVIATAGQTANVGNVGGAITFSLTGFCPTGRRYKWRQNTGTPGQIAWGYVEC